MLSLHLSVLFQMHSIVSMVAISTVVTVGNSTSGRIYLNITVAYCSVCVEARFKISQTGIEQ